MYQINNKDFKILIKYKEFLNILDNALENIPRKDIFYKDQIRNVSYEVLSDILNVSYEDDNDVIWNYKKQIKANIAKIDFLIERLFNKHYISEKLTIKLSSPLVETNKMVSGWINNMVENNASEVE